MRRKMDERYINEQFSGGSFLDIELLYRVLVVLAFLCVLIIPNAFFKYKNLKSDLYIRHNVTIGSISSDPNKNNIHLYAHAGYDQDVILRVKVKYTAKDLEGKVKTNIDGTFNYDMKLGKHSKNGGRASQLLFSEAEQKRLTDLKYYISEVSIL